MKRILALVLAALTRRGAARVLRRSAKYIVLEDNFGAEEYAIGFRKDDYALAAKVQEILDEMSSDGTAGKISETWFGNKDAFLTGKEFPRAMQTVDGRQLSPVCP